ncbi:fibronectin type III domain-containing protein [Cellulomonas sp. JH27-2]|uniref:fibronectin type III domain-containing protein n=1 Tax=Cellulomonas sp. JH27-2 TaxID=2774139 RepID=UPI00177AE437|nr:fibronectin type III domain-containing protein [Cellulomonas sp. JH27-2]
MSLARRFGGALVSASLLASMLVVGASPGVAADATTPVPTSSEVSGATPTFAWSPVPGAVGYSIEFALDTDPTSTRVATIRTTNTRWIPTGQLGATDAARTLQWRVASYSSTSDSSRGDWSAWGTYDQPPTGSPDPVSPADGAAIEYPAPVVFQWSAVAGATSYEVQYTSEPSGWSNAQSIAVKGGTTASPSTLLARTRKVVVDGVSTDVPVVWRWHVRAVLPTASGTTLTGPFGAERNLTFRWSASSRPVLTAPDNLEAPGAEIVAVSDPKFSWDPVPGAASYQIRFGMDASSDRTELRSVVSAMTTTVTSTVYVPTAPMLDNQYYWQVTPLDAAGNPGPASDVWLFKKEWGAQSAPSAADDETSAYPIPLVGSSTAATAPVIPVDKFLVSWQPLARATAYRVEVSSTDGKSTVTCLTASTSATVVALYGTTDAPSATKLNQQGSSCLWSSSTPIQAGKTYRWRVQGIDAAGPLSGSPDGLSGTIQSDWSDPQSSEFPSRYRYVTVGAATTSVDGQLTLASDATVVAAAGEPAPLMTWNRVTGADYYVVEVGLNSTVSTNRVATFATTGTQLRATGVFTNNTVAQPYYWRVRAAVGTSPTLSGTTYLGEWSNVKSWSRLSTPSVGVAWAAQPKDPGTIVVSWTPQIVSAPADGGSRGYAVTVRNSDGALVGSENAKLEYPFFVLRNPTSGKSLARGPYTVSVAPLDSTGAAGTASDAIRIDMPAAQPTNLRSTTTGAAVRLLWDTAPIASKYTVQYRVLGSSAAYTSIDTPGITTVLLNDIAPGDYEWKVVGTDVDGTGYASSAATFTVGQKNPTLVTADGATLSSSAVASGSAPVILQWSAVAGASRYVVRIAHEGSSISSGYAYETSATSLAPVGLGSASPFRYGTAYQWQVQAIPETVGSQAVLGTSSIRRFTVTTTPDAPNQPAPSVTGTSVALTWPALTGAAAGSGVAPTYELRYRISDPTGSGNAWTVTTLGANTLGTTLRGLKTATTYEFGVRARNGEGTGPWSGTSTATTPTFPGLVGTPTATPALGSFSLSWNSPSNTGGASVSRYDVEYWTGSSAHTVKSAPYGQLQVTGLARGASYTVRVAAVNAVGRGPWYSITVVTRNLASAPQKAVASAGNGQAKVSWSAPSSTGGSAVQSYVVERRELHSSKWSGWTLVGQTSNATTRSFTSTGLVNGTRYEFRVRATTAMGQGSNSNSASVMPAGPASAPTNVTVTAKSHKATVKWSKPAANGSTIKGYIVQYSTNGTSWHTLKTTSSSARSYTWTKAKKGKSYYLRVIANSTKGKSTPGGPVSFTAP